MSAATLGWLGVAMAIFLAANSLLRAHAGGALGLAWLVFALCLFTVGNLIMVRIMRESGLAVAMSVSAILQLLLANAVAFAVFGERPGTLQMAGIALGAVAVTLILWPGSRPG